VDSVYVGHPGLDTHVTHLLLARGMHQIESRKLSHRELPVVHSRRRCLYDHLQRLQDFAAELRLGCLQADVLDETLLALEGDQPNSVIWSCDFGRTSMGDDSSGRR
jgi:hypothetical protein